MDKLNPGDKVTVKESDALPFQAVVRSVNGSMVYLEGSSVPAYIGNVTASDLDAPEDHSYTDGIHTIFRDYLG